MIKNKGVNESTYISELAIFGIQEKKGNQIVRLDLRNINSSVADYFVVCHAESTTQVKAITKSIEDEVYKVTGEWPLRVEGLQHGEWILLDYVDVVIHVFKTDKREYYGIEELWGDAETMHYQSA
ncbi:Iojap protein [Arcticibacter svalbardensis MN12-7]|uniref:Ribosomal silencing factor RsfS n=1 Tax=Arcticibacter svalbardensis MN12-7 TaxID=1150600 RepID=R9GT49_9SPHI|nr:ribosome silencing factor [Arcticibacter svalbardensis]EOR94705.1 Iojap protein [Arcticibacter svalbardensis MN12-7]